MIMVCIQACILYCSGEIHVVEFGHHEICGIFPAASMSPYAASLVVTDTAKRLAYLSDATTIQIYDLHTDQALECVEHHRRIDWLVKRPFSQHHFSLLLSCGLGSE